MSLLPVACFILQGQDSSDATLLLSKACSTASPVVPIILPTTSATAQFQVLGNIDIGTGQLGWLTTTKGLQQLPRGSTVERLRFWQIQQ